MQKSNKIRGSKLVKFLLIAVLLLSLLIIAVTANAEDFTVNISLPDGNYDVGDDVEITVSITNNKSTTEAGMIMRADLPSDKITLINNSVKIKVNNGAWNQAASSRSYASVLESTDYEYYYGTSGTYKDRMFVSLCDIAPGETVTVVYTVHIESNDTIYHYCSFFSNQDNSKILATSPLITITPLPAIVRPAVEKTSRNLSSSGVKANIGDVIEYTIKATNATSKNNSLWKDVTVTDVLPEGVTFLNGTVVIDGVSANNTKYYYNEVTRTLTVFLPDLGPNASSSVSFHVSINDGTHGQTISNSVVVSGKDQVDEDKEKEAEGKDGDGNTVVSEFKINFNKGADDVEGTMNPQTVIENKREQLNPCEFTRSGYVFAGWSINPNSSVVTYKDRDYITATRNMELYAVWVRGLCTITFDKHASDATGTMAPQEVGVNVTVGLNANAFIRPGYYFRGWSTSPDGKEIAYVDRGAITPTGDITLYAVWGADPCTITFYKGAADATGTMEPQKASANVPVALNKNKFDRGGYYFAGWSTDPYSEIEEYKDEQVITPVDDMALYAVWKPFDFEDEGIHSAYLNGYPDGSVRADNNITRAEAAMIFFRLLTNDEKNDPVDGKFGDVESGKWYTQAVNFMAKAGVVNGYPDGTFRPNQDITRAEFAKMAARFDSLSLPAGDAFSDVKSNHWAYLYINSAYEKGWVKGYDDGTFRPERNITRAEVVSIVNSMLRRKIDDGALAQITNPYNDIRVNHWAYADVIEASKTHEYVRDAGGIETWTQW